MDPFTLLTVFYIMIAIGVTILCSQGEGRLFVASIVFFILAPPVLFLVWFILFGIAHSWQPV